MSNVENVRQMYYQHQNKWYLKGVYLPKFDLASTGAEVTKWRTGAEAAEVTKCY